MADSSPASAPAPTSEGRPAPAPLDGYQRRLIVFLAVATFFEGFDWFALAQILPSLRADFHLSRAGAGWLVAMVNVGTVLAYLLVRQADHWGRRRVLSITIIGYTLLSLGTGLATNVWVFGACQLAARTFLIAEWAVAMVYAAEEFPAERRGLVIGLIQACSSLGAIACAGVVPLLLRAPWGWRSVFFVGTVPLLVMAMARRSLRETARFVAARAASATAIPARPSLTHIFRTPWRGRMLKLALIWTLTYTCTQSAITFWKEFAVGERGMTDAQVGMRMSLASVAAMPLVFAVGKILDLIGRRRGALLIFGTTAASVWAIYSLRSHTLLGVALVFAVFGASSVMPVLNAYNTELFPTTLRSDAFAWSNNLLGRIGFVLSPLGVGQVAERAGWGPAVSMTAVFPLAALALIWMWMPETRGRELEETSAVDGAAPQAAAEQVKP